ncbi:hypothetical protein M431DRAFT_19462 [Trichoderma harzianum CBS 226.95]|uniref:Uncharacterized protein n=1 Tax=Trichoderma harzianum CBS 226.95 TaxID=983964 RepID=A0A2T4A330_TRIHA|nr:hypothetical protein M431DRAFT_19462 [Trichoderma harzianum CBS 226.95]PTB51471.1 hypothetical protein M431DRAFT_19462 [Trichoderma harzianum CBS 226.95]
MDDQTNDSAAVESFTLHIPQGDIDDLKQRIAQTRWADKEVTDGSFQGTPLSMAQKTTKIDNLSIHFFHIRPKEPNAKAILLTHGWPGSFVEFLKCIPLLIDPASNGGRSGEAFHVIIPSLPGWGFTEQPKEIGWNMEHTAKALVTLMEQRLGYEKWFAQGGDYGAAITTLMAQMRPKGLVAIHLNLLLAIPKTLENPTDEESRALEAFHITQNEMSGWKWISSTRPQTIAYLLSDSSVGQAMWIYDKYQDWTDNSGDPVDALTLDEMLDYQRSLVFTKCWFHIKSILGG